MDEATAAHASHMKRVERNQFLANTFEFPSIMNEINRLMKEVAGDLEEMKKVWATAKETRDFIATSKDQLWSAVKPGACPRAAVYLVLGYPALMDGRARPP